MVLDLAGIDAVIAKLIPKKGLKKTPSENESSEKSSEKTPSENESSEKSSEKMPSENESSEKSSEKTSDKIIDLLREDPSISAASIAKRLSLSSRAIEKQLASLQTHGKIIRIGADRGGYWEVRDIL